ncbi:MAG: hypothetical protein JWL71_2807 [Acidobacteria bacterium]|nr:hypothetical protein [Acidobacteriota bacterium]
MTSPPVTIAIVGGGGTGVLAACHLRRALGRAARILLIEKRRGLGRGRAYSTADPSHLLNVRVANMSAFPSDPDHFLRWLQINGPELGVDAPTRYCFVPRRVYGDYLASLVADSRYPALEIVCDECVDAEERDGGVRLSLASGSVIDAEYCILATGNDGRPAKLGGASISAWAPEALDNLASDATVLIIGAGLTMIDTVLTLTRTGHRGRIVAVSRRGLLPSAHRDVTAWPLEPAEVPCGAPVSRLLRWIRAHVAECEARGGDWRSVVDALRPHTRALWTAMSSDARRRFLRHARPWWDVHRHRMAPAVAHTVHRLLDEGRLEIRAGRVLECRRSGGRMRVAYRARGAAAAEWLTVDRVIESIGLVDDPRHIDNPLVQALLSRGLARPDALGIGLDVTDVCSLVRASGEAGSRIFAIGPQSRARFWEIVAIPDIRLQCAELAAQFASTLPAAASLLDRVRNPVP